MKKIMIVIISIILIISCYSWHKSSTISFRSEFRNQYHITMALHPDENYYDANVIIGVKNTSDDLWNELVLRDYPSQFQQVTNGAISQISSVYNEKSGKALTYQRAEDPTIISIALDQPLLPNEETTISFFYQASIPNINERFGYVEKEDGKKDLYLGNSLPILSVYEDGRWVNEPYFSAGECFYSEVADYQVQITLPLDYTVIATGEVEQSSFDVTTKTTSYNAKSVRDFCIVAGNDYRNISYIKEGIHYNSYYHSQNLQAGLEALLSLDQAMESLNNTLGKYPYQTINTVETYMQMQGMEYPQLIMISEDINGNLSTIKHEMAHQWFYGIIGNNSYQEAWLDESIATYLAEDVIKGHQSIINKNYQAYATDADYTYAMYFSGGSMYTELAEKFGKEKLHKVLRTYLSEYAYRNTKTDDLLKLLVEQLGKDSIPILSIYFQDNDFLEASKQS